MRFIFFFFIFLGVNSAFSEPIISLSKTSFDLGDIKEGRVVKNKLTIENKGDKDLVIETKVSCGCVKILGEKKFKILPYKKEDIHFSFDSTGYEGKVIHYIFVNSNDPMNKSLKVPISASVIRRPQDVLERFLSFNLSLIISSGLIDGLNPCAFTVLVFFISFLTFVGYTKKKMFMIGVSFILTVFITYILIGFGLFEFIRKLESFFFVSQWVSVLVSILAILLGVISLYDFFIYKKTKDFERIKLKLPVFVKEKIHDTIYKKTDIRRHKILTKDLRLLLSSVSCGFIVSLLESICTGQIYLPTIVYILKISPYRLQAFGYLLLYNLMFIFPLLFIFYLGLRGLDSKGFTNFARKNLGKVKLITAFIFFLLGVAIIVITQPVLFSKSSKLNLIIVEPKDCLTCKTDILYFLDKRIKV